MANTKHAHTAATNTRTSMKLVADTNSASMEELIRARAYELFVARGRQEGHDLDDWLLAEQEIVHPKSRGAAA